MSTRTAIGAPKATTAKDMTRRRPTRSASVPLNAAPTRTTTATARTTSAAAAQRLPEAAGEPEDDERLQRIERQLPGGVGEDSLRGLSECR